MDIIHNLWRLSMPEADYVLLGEPVVGEQSRVALLTDDVKVVLFGRLSLGDSISITSPYDVRVDDCEIEFDFVANYWADTPEHVCQMLNTGGWHVHRAPYTIWRDENGKYHPV